jgi:hypothetical protein
LVSAAGFSCPLYPAALLSACLASRRRLLRAPPRRGQRLGVVDDLARRGAGAVEGELLPQPAIGLADGPGQRLDRLGQAGDGTPEALLWLDKGAWLQESRPAAALAGLRVPIYFCHARADGLVPWAGAESMYAGCRGPKWRFWAENPAHANIRNRCRAEYLRRPSGSLEGRLVETAG